MEQALDAACGPDRYSEVALTAIEQFIAATCLASVTDAYDIDVFTALLRLYALYPARQNVDLVRAVLLRAVARLPEEDFVALLYLTPTTTQAKLAAVVELGRTLDNCRFEAFWDAFESAPEARAVAGLEERCREIILDAIAVSHESIPTDRAERFLNVDGPTLKKLAENRKWTVGGGVAKVAERADQTTASAASVEKTDGADSGLALLERMFDAVN